MIHTKKLLNYMLHHGSVTTGEAFLKLGISRLSARIWDLRHDGYDIPSKMISVETRDGSAHVSSYYLSERDKERLKLEASEATCSNY